jgi:hypothetical protein
MEQPLEDAFAPESTEAEPAWPDEGGRILADRITSA